MLKSNNLKTLSMNKSTAAIDSNRKKVIMRTTPKLTEKIDDTKSVKSQINSKTKNLLKRQNTDKNVVE